jgi:hypothetical protein
MKTKMRTKRIIKDQKGGALVEFAIVLPLLVILFAGIIEFSLCYYNKQVITNASREAARAGINGLLTEPDLRDIINDYCFGDDVNDGFNDEPRLITFGSDISAFPACGTPSCIEISNNGTDLKVSVKYVYNFLLPSFIGVGSSITLNGQTEMDMF